MSLSAEIQTIKEDAEAVTCWSWALFKGWKLGPGADKAGPCPNCAGTDRFAIHTTKNTLNCRQEESREWLRSVGLRRSLPRAGYRQTR